MKRQRVNTCGAVSVWGGREGNAVCEDACPSHKVKIFLMVAYDVLKSDMQILFSSEWFSHFLKRNGRTLFLIMTL